MAGASPSPPANRPGSFVDSARVHARAGHGGRGSASFRREPFVPRGGPDGGDGGRGGSVLVVASPQVSSLHEFVRRRRWKAEDGRPGAKARKVGRAGADVRLEVPVGTVISDAQTGEVIADLDRPGSKAVVARGGAGGRGNVHFKSSVNQAPDFAEPGRPGEERELELNLKLIADVGLVGPPNAGKSSLLAAISAARPKVGDYAFTTLDPELGVVAAGAERMVVADIPGLIEGAARGAGLGLRFLRHVERTRVLVYVVDGAAPDPLGDLAVVRAEVASYSRELARRPSLTVVNKIDLAAAQDFGRRVGRRDLLFCSAKTGEGIPELLEAIRSALAEAPRPEPEVPAQRLRPRRSPAEAPVVRRRSWGFEVRGGGLERLLERVDFDSHQSFDWFQVQLDRLGVSAALEEAGVEPGDTVRIGELEFEYQP
ncbi:MAG TPA: GTPase ObgE [Candidatus Dormibacteraeota bacterium]